MPAPVIPTDEIKERVLKAARRSNGLIALTGAGISAPSGVPVYRDANGVWRKDRPQSLMSSEAFNKDPKLIWDWYANRLEYLQSVKPNSAHEALARLEHRGALSWVITQNVDPLHAKAGSTKIIRLHGDITTARCVQCHHIETLSVSPPEACRPLKCSQCGGLMRPGVVWFGESLDQKVLLHAFEVAGQCSACLVIGTSSLVVPAARIPLYAKTQNNALIIEFNLKPTSLTQFSDLFIEGDASLTVPQFADWILQELDQ